MREISYEAGQAEGINSSYYSASGIVMDTEAEGAQTLLASCCSRTLAKLAAKVHSNKETEGHLADDMSPSPDAA